MTKHQIGFWLLVAGVIIHAIGNLKKAADQVQAGVTPGTTDVTYYGASAALVLGIVLLWGSIK